MHVVYPMSRNLKFLSVVVFIEVETDSLSVYIRCRSSDLKL